MLQKELCGLHSSESCFSLVHRGGYFLPKVNDRPPLGHPQKGVLGPVPLLDDRSKRSPIPVRARSGFQRPFVFLTYRSCSNQFLTCFHKIFIFKRKKLRSFFCYGAQGCALRKISGSPLGSQAFYLSCPDLKVGRPNKNLGEPFGLPSIPAGVPRPLKLVARVHLMRKYFVRT